MNRIEEKLAQLKEQNKKAFITYMTAGMPDFDKMQEIIRTQEQAGTDIIELGIPFSDPVADGPVIQDASYHAILKGVNLKKVLEAMKKLRSAKIEIPIVFMMYYNTILHYGVEAFVDACIESGVDGLIIPDLPLEEQDEIKEFLQKENAPILIQLVSPVSKDRIPEILKDARGFVYCVSSMGVTGQEATFHKSVIDYLGSVKEVSKIPVMMGFGIRTAEDVAPMKDIIDGAIVGSHFIRLMEENDYDLQKIAKKCAAETGADLKEGTYLQFTGPAYESPQEVAMARTLGADAVGMSTACEAVAANHMGMRIVGISCISNLACGISPQPLSHKEVQEAADAVAPVFQKLVTQMIKEIGTTCR